MITIVEPYYSETIVSNSRFLLYLEKCDDRSNIKARVEELRAMHPHANHVCSAFRLLGENTPQPQVGFDDDGEPNGSAGKPMLAPIVGSDGINIAAYVVRYFGGVKLGVGGLVRAYGNAVSEAFKEAKFEKYIQKTSFLLEVGYKNIDLIKYFLEKNKVEILDVKYETNVKFT